MSSVTVEVTEEGCTCPTCGQFVKLYRRPINCAMALALIHIYRHFERPGVDEWLHVPQFLVRWKIARADEAKLVHWDLLEARPGERDDGSNRNGFYKITPLGRMFVRREVQVPKYIYLYNQTVYGFSNGSDRPMDLEVPRKMTDIREALTEKFNYAELMGFPQLELL